MKRSQTATRYAYWSPPHAPGFAPAPATLSRRGFLQRGLWTAALALTGAAWTRALADGTPAGKLRLPPLDVADLSARAPALPVAIGRCRDFEVPHLTTTLRTMFDQLGGIDTLVRGKTVTMKLNNTGNGKEPMHGCPSERSYQVHPHFIEALCAEFARAGARRIYIVESFYENNPPEVIYRSQGWDVARIHRAGENRVVFEDTKGVGIFKDYAKVPVPWGGFVFPAYHLNRRYVETDVFVSVGKLKNHLIAGVTGAVKNLFGISPIALYGNDAPNEHTSENRAAILHNGVRAVPAGVTAERYPGWGELPDGVGCNYRVPRVIADLLGARPVDLAVVEAIQTCQGGEGPWCPHTRLIAPGLVLAGRNAVNVDAIGTAVAGYDPLAGVAHTPWLGESHLTLLARAGVGTQDPGRIEVRGLSLKEALFPYEPGIEGWVQKHT